MPLDDGETPRERIGGTRRLELAPSVAYGDAGVPGAIPPGATLTVEITVLAAVDTRP